MKTVFYVLVLVLHLGLLLNLAGKTSKEKLIGTSIFFPLFKLFKIKLGIKIVSILLVGEARSGRYHTDM